MRFPRGKGPASQARRSATSLSTVTTFLEHAYAPGPLELELPRLLAVMPLSPWTSARRCFLGASGPSHHGCCISVRFPAGQRPPEAPAHFHTSYLGHAQGEPAPWRARHGPVRNCSLVALPEISVDRPSRRWPSRIQPAPSREHAGARLLALSSSHILELDGSPDVPSSCPSVRDLYATPSHAWAPSPGSSRDPSVLRCHHGWPGRGRSLSPI